MGPGQWAGILHIPDLARYGVGLYHVTAEAQGCSIPAWVKVSDRSPFTTASGLGGAVAIALGLILLLVAFVKGSVIAGIAGGAIGGLGANVLTQQFGLTPVTGSSLAIWILLPGAGGGVLSAALVAVRRPRAAPKGAATAPPGFETPPPGAEAEPPGAEAEPPGAEAEPPGAEAAPPEANGGPHAEPPGDHAEPDPPRKSFALLRSPETVVAGVEFGIEVGLSPSTRNRASSEIPWSARRRASARTP